ncbi:hypothetical protein [Mycoplasma sp. E35C]|uniref:hypothetical protein n=1 Tax=Mycoplasma sp. E35C TaxID=2801918 RepID=UPI001CA426EA|nr:hypothetical protein [Mycoplasma sp. E35C]QZX49340.1 hypothetical protein JJE79_01150 [Mycoplasma sp. E35C]
MDSDKKNKTVRFKTSSKEIEKFERVKLEDTKVFDMEERMYKIELTEKLFNLKAELENTVDKATRKSLEKEIKQIEKDLAKLDERKK